MIIPAVHRLHPRGYTLVEILASAVIIGASMSAAVSLATTLKMQEEMSWRATVANNYQEVACRLWQLGQTPSDIAALMPSTAANRPLNDCLADRAGNAPPVQVTTLTTSNKASLGVLEGVTTELGLESYDSAPAGAITTFQVYRPSTRGATAP